MVETMKGQDGAFKQTMNDLTSYSKVMDNRFDNLVQWIRNSTLNVATSIDHSTSDMSDNLKYFMTLLKRGLDGT